MIVESDKDCFASKAVIASVLDRQDRNVPVALPTFSAIKDEFDVDTLG